MKFIVQKEVFDKLDDLYIGVVVAKGVDNSKEYKNIDKMLNESMANAKKEFLDVKAKEDPRVIPYREGFQKVGINPNKFQCSVEAMVNSISKGRDVPNINPLVNLNNAISLKYTLPMGTHNLGLSDSDVELRFAVDEDTFTPMGSDEPEKLEQDELVYVVDHKVRTRRWAWRQSKEGMIDKNTEYVFFPIDGFKGFNDDKVNEAMKELEEVLKKEFNCETRSGFVDKDHLEFEWDL